MTYWLILLMLIAIFFRHASFRIHSTRWRSFKSSTHTPQAIKKISSTIKKRKQQSSTSILNWKFFPFVIADIYLCTLIAGDFESYEMGKCYKQRTNPVCFSPVFFSRTHLNVSFFFRPKIKKKQNKKLKLMKVDGANFLSFYFLLCVDHDYWL